jgi:hypothetical protein
MKTLSNYSIPSRGIESRDTGILSNAILRSASVCVGQRLIDHDKFG